MPYTKVGGSSRSTCRLVLEPDCNHNGLGDETQDPNPSCATGQRAAALKKCKKKFRHNNAKRRKCRKKAKKLPV